MFGLLNIHKPAGITSRDVVDHVEKVTGGVKAGHAGTLDPLAEGVIVVCLGRATRLIRFVQQLPKHYQATFLLGRRSDTDDVEGEIVELEAAPQPSLEQIRAELPKFVGEILQTPPVYSAVKLQGRRAYKLARQGRPVVPEPRPVVIYELDLAAYDYPELKLTIRCGSGTYVRSIGRDLGERLGTAAVMSQLTRTAIGHFTLAGAVSLAELTSESVAQHVRPASEAVRHLPSLQVGVRDIDDLAHGRSIGNPLPNVSEALVALSEAGELVAVLEARGGRLWSTINFARP